MTSIKGKGAIQKCKKCYWSVDMVFSKAKKYIVKNVKKITNSIWVSNQACRSPFVTPNISCLNYCETPMGDRSLIIMIFA